MFRMIKIIFRAFLIVLAIVGFNAIGGQKYVEVVKTNINNFIQERAAENAKRFGDFSNLHEEFQIDNTLNVLGYSAVLAAHKNSGQKMCIVDSKKKPLLTQEDIKSQNLDTQLKDLANKFRYKAVSDVEITNRGTLTVYGRKVPYAKFEAKVNKLPFSDIAGIVASVKTSDGSEKLIVSINEKRRYSQLITDEFYKNVKEN
ncbi:MAG: hypothetical protein MJ231_04245 [bacterium]|nr:hypothetical protein [bacterium]